MEQALIEIFQFLISNREYNRELQTSYYKYIILPQEQIPRKVIALLYHVANTQSQPNINKLASFCQLIEKGSYNLESFEGFMSIIDPNHQYHTNHEGLFRAMMNQNGWGEKTSALFTKSIYHLHNGNYPTELQLWNDVPAKIEIDGKLFLPVDRVIISIFNFNFLSDSNVILTNHYPYI
tara:strand:- start:15 stop:551 length:537 start_codon:yes stop_codon:yes gene_type:complete